MYNTKAIQFIKPGEVEIIEFDTPLPAPTQVGIRMYSTSLCNHSELRSYHGGQKAGYGSCYPMIPGEPGHEGVGEIISIGEDITKFKKGDIVALTGHGGEPVHRSYLLRDEKSIAKIELNGRDPHYASILEMYGCAYHCIRVAWNNYDGYDNKKVAVIGAGSIGLCAVQILRYWPLKELIAIDIDKTKLELAKSFGSTDSIFIPEHADPEAFLPRLPKFDIVIECSGSINGQILAHAMNPKILINVSYCPKPVSINQSRWFNSNTIIYNPGFLNSDELRAVAEMYSRGLLNPEQMINKRIYPNPDIYLETIKEIEKGKIIKALIDWDTE